MSDITNNQKAFAVVMKQRSTCTGCPMLCTISSGSPESLSQFSKGLCKPSTSLITSIVRSKFLLVNYVGLCGEITEAD